MISLFFDAVSDPLLGRWSDRFESRLGRRHPFIYASILPAPLFYYLLWNPPALSGSALFCFLVATAVALRLALTLYVVPMLAMIPELTSDYDERTRLLNYMVSADWFFGTMMAVAMFGYWLADTPEFPTGILRIDGYRASGTVGAAVILAAMAVSAWATRHNVPRLRRPPARSANLRGSLRELRQTLDDASFIALLVAGVFNAAAGGMTNALWIYVQPYFWGFDSDQLTWMLVAQLGSAVVAFALLPPLANRTNKKTLLIWIATASLFVASGPVCLRLLGWFPGNGDPALFPVMLIASALVVALIIMAYVITGSMISDIVEARELVTNRREEGMLISLQSLLAKVAGGIGVWLAGLILAAIDFPLSADPSEVPAETIRELGIAYGPMIAVLFVAAITAIGYYDIDRLRHRANVAELAARSRS